MLDLFDRSSDPVYKMGYVRLSLAASATASRIPLFHTMGELRPAILLRNSEAPSAHKRRVVSLVSLLLLTLQNTALVLLMKYSYRAEAARYSSSSAVMVAEFVKFIICVSYISVTDGISAVWRHLRTTPAQVTLSIPCILYVAQNNLLFDAVRNLPTTIYVVCSQGKILSSAFFSYALLGTVLSRRRVLMLALLIVGMILVQAPAPKDSSLKQNSEGNQMRGLCSIFLACLTSGFAGVYLERIYKGGDGGKSVWTKNMQLSCFSLPLSFLVAIHSDAAVSFETLFAGYDVAVVGVILLQAAGGLIVAIVMRYASTILKCFAVSASICVCAMIAMISGQEEVTAQCIAGVTLVMTATLVYGM